MSFRLQLEDAFRLDDAIEVEAVFFGFTQELVALGGLTSLPTVFVMAVPVIAVVAVLGPVVAAAVPVVAVVATAVAVVAVVALPVLGAVISTAVAVVAVAAAFVALLGPVRPSLCRPVVAGLDGAAFAGFSRHRGVWGCGFRGALTLPGFVPAVSEFGSLGPGFDASLRCGNGNLSLGHSLGGGR